MTEKQLYTKVKFLTVSAVITVVILLLFIFVQSIILSSLNGSKAKLENSLEVLNSKAQDLQAEIDYRNSRTYIEQYARENLGLCYSDENKYTAEE